MGRKFVRNITGTNLGGNKLTENNGTVEPFYTNVQNDILSDDEDIYIRQVQSENVKDNYHCLTDNVKQIESVNDVTKVTNKDKNSVDIDVKETVIESTNQSLTVNNPNTNEFELSINKSSKTESENGTDNNHLMTPLQTKHAIDYNNENVIPGLVVEHETETDLASLSQELIVIKNNRNKFSIELNLDGINTVINDLTNEVNNLINEVSDLKDRVQNLENSLE